MVRSASRTSTPAEGVLKQEISFPPSQPSAARSEAESLSFWEHLYDVPENQWATEFEKGFRVYLYDHDSPGSKYLAVIFHPFDIEWIKQTYGGGRYRGQLNDSSGRIVSKEIFSIEGESKRKPPQNAQNSTAPPVPDSFQSQMLEIMREGQRRQEDLIRQLMDRSTQPAAAAAIPAIDPNIMLRGVVEMFSGLLTKAQAPQPQMSLLDMVALVEKFKGPDLLTVLTQAKAAGLIPAVGTGGDLLSQITQLKEAATVIGLGENKGKSLGEALIEKGPEIIEAGVKMIDRYHAVEATRLQTAREVRVIQQQQRLQTPAPQNSPQHSAVTSAGQPSMPVPSIEHAAGIGLDVEAPGSVVTPEAINEAERQLKFVKEQIVKMISEGKTGVEIIDFLDNIDKTICDGFAGARIEQIIDVFSSDPHLRKATALPRFKAVIAEMVEELNAPPDEIDPAAKVVN